MAIFLLTYDLHNEQGPAHYTALWAELKRLRAHRVMERACLVNLDTDNPRRVVETLKPLTESRDRLLASRMDPGSYWYLNAGAETNDWLRQNPPVALPAKAEAPGSGVGSGASSGAGAAGPGAGAGDAG